MFAGTRLRMMAFSLSLVAAGSLLGCRKDEVQATKKPVGVLNGDSAKRSLEALEPKLSALNGKFAALHKQVDPLPPNLAGFGELRAKFYNTDIGMGVMGPKITWLSGRLDAALQSGDRDELQQITQDIARTHEELGQIDRIAVEVLHQVLPFQRMAELQAKEAGGSTSFVRILSTGHTLKADADGIEQRLLGFIEEPSKSVDDTSWFEFDRVHFTGLGAELDRARSETQLGNVAEILKAHPRVTLAISGDTDRATANKKLAKQRARAIETELVRLGVAPSRLDAEGSGKRPAPRGSVAVRVSAK